MNSWMLQNQRNFHRITITTLRNNYCMEFSRQINFAGFFINFWILGHFIFAVLPKYCITRYLDIEIWQSYYNLQHLNLAIVLKIVSFMCVSFQHFSKFGKSLKPPCRPKYILVSLSLLALCTCLYSFTVKASSVCNGLDILKGTDQRSCVLTIILNASA